MLAIAASVVARPSESAISSLVPFPLWSTSVAASAPLPGAGARREVARQLVALSRCRTRRFIPKLGQGRRQARTICTMVTMDENIANEAWWRRQAAAQGEWWKKRSAGQQEETLRQNNLMYGGLIGIGVVMVQPFLTPGAASLDPSAQICVIAFSLAIPLLSALIVLNRHETYRRRVTSSVIVLVAQQAALGLGFAGVVAGFWHIMTIAGIAILVGTILGLAVHSAGYVRVEEDDAQATPGAEQPPQL